jgi:hypothetical protein
MGIRAGVSSSPFAQPRRGRYLVLCCAAKQRFVARAAVRVQHGKVGLFGLKPRRHKTLT